ncbi:MAG: putative Ig domain-containing protein [Planctomycetes bacterium]|nr:putative Ig domain-containing protein [Planctomycetota bacterium]
MRKILVIICVICVICGYGGLCHKKDKHTGSNVEEPLPPDTGSSGPPAQTSSPDPADGAVNVLVDKVLSWAPADEADSYNIYFGSSNPPIDNLAPENIANTTATSWDPRGLTVGATYYWRIDAKNDKGVTKGNVWHFTTVPAAPELATAPNPPNGATNVSISAQLSWSAPCCDPATYAESYNVYLGTDNPPSNIINGTNTTTNTYSLSTLTASTTYYWRLDTKNFTATTQGAVWSFQTAVNSAPNLAGIGNKTVNENVLLTFIISATDPEGQPLVYSATGLPSGATFTPSTKTFAWAPDYTQAGVYPGVKFRATDIGGLYAEESITITVNNVDRPPVLTQPPDKSVDEQMNLAFTLAATDPDGDSIVYTMTSTPTGATLVSNVFSWTPSYTQAGVYPVIFTATANGLTNSTSITITVNEAVATTLAFSAQPQSTTAGATMPAITVQVRDQNSNTLQGVSVAITTTDSTRVVYQAGTQVTGYATATSDASGIAIFSTISMTQSGIGYVFRASGAGTPQNSNPFNITNAAVTTVTVSGDDNITAGISSTAYSAVSKDAYLPNSCEMPLLSF